MQLMPDTADCDWFTRLAGRIPEPVDPADSLELGACYLRLPSMLGGGTRPALAAHNAGQGVVGGGSRRLEVRIGSTSTTIIRGRAFVERVERYWELYARVHPDAFSETEDPA